MNKTLLFSAIVMGALTVGSQAFATPACEQTYKMGGAALDADDSVSLLSPIDGELVWLRAKDGASPQTLARLGANDAVLTSEYLPVSLHADAASDVAYQLSYAVLSEVSASGVARISICESGEAAHAVARGPGRWTIATTCSVPGGAAQLRLSTRPDGGTLRELARLELGASGELGGLALADEGADRHAIRVGARLVAYTDGTFTVDEAGARTIDRNARFVTDVAGTTLFSLDATFAVGGTVSYELTRTERDAAGAWSSTSQPIAITDPSDVFPIDRATVMVVSYGTRAYVMRDGGPGWAVDRELALAGPVVAVRGARALSLRYDGDDVKVDLHSINGVTDVGTAGEHDGQTGCCSVVGSHGAPATAAPLLLLAVVALFRRRFRVAG